MLTSALGWVFYWIAPKSYRQACMEDFFAGEGPAGWMAHLIRKEIVRRYRALPDAEKRRMNREKFWGAQPGLKWHEMKRELYSDPKKFGTDFLRLRGPLVKQIQDLSAACPEIDTLCHIGTGHGILLDYLTSQVPGIRKFVGIDISADQIRMTQERYRGNPKLEFHHIEALDWLKTRQGKGTIFVAVGTLQYFTPEEMEEFVRAVKELAHPGAIAISETVSVRMTSAVHSTPRGDINYNHPYPDLFRRERYHLFRHTILPVDEAFPTHTQIVLTATTAPIGSRSEKEVPAWEPAVR